MKNRIKSAGDFNGWKGNIGLYFNTKEVRLIGKEIGIAYAQVKNMTISEVYNCY